MSDKYLGELFANNIPAFLKNGKKSAYYLRGDHNIKTRYKLHNLNDAINDFRDYNDKSLLEYVITTENGDVSYDLFKVSDLFDKSYLFNDGRGSNLMGFLREEISRRITKTFLREYDSKGELGSSFEKESSDPNEDLIIEHSENYILRTKNYPNMIIVKKTKDRQGKHGYIPIKELDGLFEYIRFRKRSIVVLESKLYNFSHLQLKNKDDINIPVKNLFYPLMELFKDSDFYFLIFADKSKVFKNIQKRELDIEIPKKRRWILDDNKAKSIHEALEKINVKTAYFTFNESEYDFLKMNSHLFLHYNNVRNGSKIPVEFRGRIISSNNELTVFDEGETPFRKFKPYDDSGLWKEVRLFHKKKK